MKTIAPTMQGIIDRRMLVNFRVHPDAITKLLPPYFRPKLVDGWAMAGICLIRLKDMRPRGYPGSCGLTSENAAHRIAVVWNDRDDHDGVREGVFIPRRDTSSSLQALAGGRIFPGTQHTAAFEVHEANDDFQLKMRSRDGAVSVELHARRAEQIPSTSIFKSLDEASDFFARGSIGYSATNNPNCCEGMELYTPQWRVEPLAVQSVSSSFFNDTSRFPNGTIEFDCALLMLNIEHEWHAVSRLEGPS